MKKGYADEVPIHWPLASFPDSIVRFRGDLIDAIQSAGLQAHIAAPDLSCFNCIGA